MTYLNSISQISPEAFERLVVDLLQNMGYGKGEAVGKSGDGWNRRHHQPGCFRDWKRSTCRPSDGKGQVGEPEIRNFSGSLDARGASKGVFVTTSSFSGNANRPPKLSLQ